MFYNESGTVVLCQEDDDICELCGKVAETRAYGPNEERICFQCGMKDMETTRRQFEKNLLGIVVN